MRNMSRYRKFIFFALLLTLIVYSIQILNIVRFPSQIDIMKGDSKDLSFFFPFSLELMEDSINIVKIDNNKEKSNIALRNSYKLESTNNGIADIKLKLLGIFPIKHVRVNVVENVHIIPGGEAIGVKLNTKGVLVVATSEISGIDGKIYNPAKNAGIRVGDSITMIDGIKVENADHVIHILNSIKDKKISIQIERNNIVYHTEVIPVKSKQDNSYRLGIWVRDKTAGIGTLTFLEPNSMKFGALGHAITDIDTGTLMKVENGEIMRAKVSSIEHGKKGSPGELRGIFFETKDVLGKIENNTNFGIYGTIHDENLTNQKTPLPIGTQSEVRIGKAHILANVEGDRVDKYEVEIIKLERQNVPQSKSMIIKITDDRLIEKTGGIVQGMSGSPILQNGKIVGAVTHVFVNDPTKGYGIYIEWMLKEAGIITNNNADFAKTK
ncbi:stage IV sporulation protein B [Proteiniborus ethanoligenes]|uniref:Stage IV sporulation protein B n=2 Tax=Proteiniborus ethanoligenes TaxID=415015 RepID=A0A1H3K974_9FIRM|nr:stage IV sporulation protein B [Proteiniborus ethanoligenes]